MIAIIGLAFVAAGDEGFLGNSGGEPLGSFLLAVSLVPILVSLSAIGAVSALGKEKMLLATWGYAVNGAGLLAAVVLLSSGQEPTTMILAIGINVGYLCQLALVGSQLSWRPDYEVPDRVTSKLATRGVLILFLASLFYKAQPLIERSVGAVLGNGIPATLGYVDKVTQGFTQCAVFGFAIASLPLLSRHMASGDDHRAGLGLGKSVAGTAAVTVLVCSIALATAGRVVELLYGRGAFDPGDVQLATDLLRISVLSVFFGALAAPLVASFYAGNRITTVIWVGLQGFLVSIIGTSVLAWLIGAQGIVLGTACGFAYTFLCFAFLAQTTLDFWTWGVWWTRFRSYVLGALAGAGLGAGLAAVIPWPDVDANAAQLVVLALMVAVISSGWLLGLLAGKRFNPDEEPDSSRAAGDDVP